MLPAFNIFLAILSDSLMPWLEKNNDLERYKALTDSMGAGIKGDRCGFFRGLISGHNEDGGVLSAISQEELQRLADVPPGPEALRMARQFSLLPAAGLKATFYQVLTGHVMGAYFDLTVPLLKNERSPAFRDYQLTKVFTRIYALFEIPVAGNGKSENDLLIVFHVKVALAALFFRLKVYWPENAIAVVYVNTLWVMLKDQAEKSGLNGQQCMLLKELFDTLTVPADKPDQKIRPSASATPPAPIEGKGDLFDLARGLRQEMGDFKSAIQQLVQSGNTGKQEESGESGMLGSGDVLRLLSVSKSTLKRLRDNKKIKYHKIGGKFLYPKTEIERIMKGNG